MAHLSLSQYLQILPCLFLQRKQNTVSWSSIGEELLKEFIVVGRLHPPLPLRIPPPVADRKASAALGKSCFSFSPFFPFLPLSLELVHLDLAQRENGGAGVLVGCKRHDTTRPAGIYLCIFLVFPCSLSLFCVCRSLCLPPCL
jgi:hypothetical protein